MFGRLLRAQILINGLQTCLRAGLVGGETFATDASVIEADARIARCTEGKEPPDDWNDPGNITRPVREYLDHLDKAAGLNRLPGETTQPPKSLSLTDPCAALTSKGKSKIVFAYGTNYLIGTKAAIIVDVEASPARGTVEVAATRVMIDRTKDRSRGGNQEQHSLPNVAVKPGSPLFQPLTFSPKFKTFAAQRRLAAIAFHRENG